MRDYLCVKKLVTFFFFFNNSRVGTFVPDKCHKATTTTLLWKLASIALLPFNHFSHHYMQACHKHFLLILHHTTQSHTTPQPTPKEQPSGALAFHKLPNARVVCHLLHFPLGQTNLSLNINKTEPTSGVSHRPK
uniref:Uncharacterized protein n=1 Tax=Anopheles atroparvus TaxID=41427 RepID=A0AAG5DRH5_ANOAO